MFRCLLALYNGNLDRASAYRRQCVVGGDARKPETNAKHGKNFTSSEKKTENITEPLEDVFAACYFGRFCGLFTRNRFLRTTSTPFPQSKKGPTSVQCEYTCL